MFILTAKTVFATTPRVVSRLHLYSKHHACPPAPASAARGISGRAEHGGVPGAGAGGEVRGAERQAGRGRAAAGGGGDQLQQARLRPPPAAFGGGDGGGNEIDPASFRPPSGSGAEGVRGGGGGGRK